MNFRSFGLVCLLALFSISDAAAQTWTSLGPTGGTVETIIAAPSQASSLLAIPGGDAGGLFLSTNSGATWTSIAPGLCDAHVTSVAFHPTQPSTILAGTLSAGVCRTTDSGATWTALASGLPTGTNNFPQSIAAIAINPSTPTTLIAGTQVGLYRSTDNGATWTLVGPSGARIQRVAISPSTPASAYATSEMAGAGVLRSTDSGATWTSASTGLPSSFDDGSSLAIDPTNPNIVYLTVDTLYKTSDGGTSWSASNSGLGSPFFISNVIIDPTNPSVLYVNSIGGSGLSRSTNGGASWTAVSNTGLPSFAGIPGVTQTLAIEPGSATNLLAGSPGFGAFRSTDAGATWSAINTNLTGRPVYAPALQPGTGTGPAPLLISTRTETDASEIHKLTGGALPFSNVTSPFTANDSGDIEWMAAHPTDASTMYVIGGTVSGQDCALPYKTTNGGTSWTLMNSGLPTTHCGNHLVIDPASPDTLYLAMFSSSATTCVYKSTNGGTTWTASSTGMSRFGVDRIAISPLNSSVLYAATGLNVFRSANGGSSWTSVSTGLPVASGGGGTDTSIKRLAINPVDDAIVYAGTSAGVYRTANSGTSWTAGTSGWPTLNGTLYSVGALAIDPVTPTTLFAAPANPVDGPSGFRGRDARGVGLYRSTDSGATWTAATGPIGGAIVTEVVFDADRAIYATTNNGLFKFAATLPTVAIDKPSLAFSAVTTGAAFTSQTSSQTVRISQTGTGTVTWTATSASPWLVVSPTSGSGSATLTVSVQFAAGLSPAQNGAITLAFAGASNTAGPVTVTLNTVTSTAAAAPIGVFDTPADGITGVAGSIGVTGWAIDDVEVTRVRIFRDPVAGEPAGAIVFLGDAVFVDGARPDIQAAYPNLPRASRAGWGYLMLTNFLPGLGNGTFVLHAIADDADGHSVSLGTKTITCSNSTATLPFGAIDTPGQGQVITSSSMNNFGWVLSPGSRKSSPPDGGAVTVFVDGLPAANPGGWTSRSDLSGLFPVAGYSGIGNALGVATLDMTVLANGVHTISWLVTDNLGGASGIGSRYFTVSRGSLMLDPSGVQLAGGRSAVIGSNPMTSLPPAAMMRVTPEPGPIAGRRGFDPDVPLQHYQSADGRATVQAEELDRIELQLEGVGGGRRLDGSSYVGYLRVGDGFAPLPVGSALNAETGEFTWQPGVAFVGAYDLVFARVAGGDAVTRRDVRVVLNAKGSNRVGPQTVIDVADGRIVAGWAADLDSQVDAGVDAIHVWAYPADGGDPIFVGAAEYGGARPDVAAIYGDRFAKSGYGIRVKGLAPGTYDLAVFAYSTVTRGFVPAKTVRVTVR